MNVHGVFEQRPGWKGRAKALGLAVAWVALWAALLVVTSYGLVLVGLLPPEVLRSANPPGIKPSEVELAHAALAVVTVVTTVIMALLTREKLTRFGFARHRAGRHSLIGLATGFALMSGTLGLMAAMGVFALGHVTIPADRIAIEVAKYAVLFVIVAVAEELWFRSFTLVQLSRALSFWPAAVLMSGLFLLSHTANIGETRSDYSLRPWSGSFLPTRSAAPAPCGSRSVFTLPGTTPRASSSESRTAAACCTEP